MNAARSALADPTICPDCRHLLADSVCTGCGLDLNGPLGLQLWSVMLQADRLIGTIRDDAQAGARAKSAAVQDPAAASGTRSVEDEATLPSYTQARSLRPHGVRVSVQGVLLALGGLLVTVAATVFLAMSWSALGVGGRTAVLGAVTAALFAAATIVARRSLGASAETLWLLVVTMSVLDVFGAAHVGLWGMDRLSWVGLTGVHATVLSVLAGAAVFISRHAAARVQPAETTGDGSGEGLGVPDSAGHVRGPVGIQLAAALGLAVWSLANLNGQAGPLSAWSLPVRASLVALLAGAVAWALTRRDVSVPLVAAGAGAGAGAAWCGLVATGVGRFVGQGGNHWSNLDGWPLLAAALPVALAVWLLAPAAAPDGASPSRPGWLSTGRWPAAAAVAAVGLISLFVAGPSASDEVTLTKVAVGTVLLAVFGAALYRRGAGAASWAGGSLTWAAVGVVALGLLLATVLADVQAAVPAYGEGNPASVLDLSDLGVPAWLIGLSAASLMAVVLLAWIRVPAARAHGAAVGGISAAIAGTGAYLIAAVTGAPLWLLGAVALVGASALWVVSARAGAAERDRSLLKVGAGVAFVVAAWDASGSHVLAGVLAGVVAALAATLIVVDVRTAAGSDRAGALTGLLPGRVVHGAAGVVVVGVAVSWFELAAAAQLASFTVAVVLAAWAAFAGLAAQAIPRTVRPSDSWLPARSVRVWAEAAAVMVGASAMILVADEFEAGVVLTLLGAAVAGVSVMTTDRTWCSWISAALLTAATLCRLETGDRFPEVYSLPVAILLVAGGLWRLRREPTMSSFSALGAGLGLGFGPSLLLSLDDSLSARALAVFVAALAVLAFGAWWKWAAPLWAGALAAGSLALVNVLPTIYVLPRWVVLGSVGVVLVGVGITWEARLREARRAGQYLGTLR